MTTTHQAAHVAVLEALRRGCFDAQASAALDAAIAAMKQQGDIRQAVADYMQSEGCGCCRDYDAHEKHTERLAELLDVAPYADGSGYDFSPFRSDAAPEASR